MFSKKKRETAKLLPLHDQSYCMVSGATRKEWEDEVVFPVGCALPFGTAVIDDRNGRLYHALRDYYAQFGTQTVQYDFSSVHHEYGYNPFAYIHTTYDASEFAAELVKQCFRLLNLRDPEAIRVQKILLTALVWRLHLDPDETKHHPAALSELLWKVADGKTPDDLAKKPGDLRVKDTSQPEYVKQLFQIWEYAPVHIKSITPKIAEIVSKLLPVFADQGNGRDALGLDSEAVLLRSEDLTIEPEVEGQIRWPAILCFGGIRTPEQEAGARLLLWQILRRLKRFCLTDSNISDRMTTRFFLSASLVDQDAADMLRQLQAAFVHTYLFHVEGTPDPEYFPEPAPIRFCYRFGIPLIVAETADGNTKWLIR